MFDFTKTSTVRAALAVAAVALFASHAAMAGQPKEISYWADSQMVSRGGDHGLSGQFASQAGDRKDGAAEQFASQAGDRKDGAAAEYASRATENKPIV